jgi:hypothetical protein
MRGKIGATVPNGNGSMHEELWAGVELKFQHAAFHLERMSRSLDPPEPTATNVALQAAGTIIDTGWQRSFYAHCDAFLSAARSIPEIIQWCFGEDRYTKDWVKTPPEEEKLRRYKFQKQFATRYNTFRKLRLSTVRNINIHRTGVPPVKVSISSRFGVTYTGSPVERPPILETPPVPDPALSWIRKPEPLHPPSEDAFTIDDDERPLFSECRGYLKAARALIEQARRVSDTVHGSKGLTVPPTTLEWENKRTASVGDD